jgi:hypothetical protein
MDRQDLRLAEPVLRAMADACPKPVHFGYLGLALGANAGAMLRTLRQLRQDGLITLDRSLACKDVPYAQARLSAKGLAVAGGTTQSADAAAALRDFDAVTLVNLQQTRLAAKTPAARATSGAARPGTPPTQKAEQLLGSAA